MNIKKSAAAIGSLIDINADRIRGYLQVAAKTSDLLLKRLFQSYAEHSRDANKTLAALLSQMGMQSAPEQTNKETATLPITQLNLQQSPAALNKRPLLAICLNSESVVLEQYNKVLSEAVDHLTIEQHKMIYKQYMHLKKDHSYLLALQA